MHLSGCAFWTFSREDIKAVQVIHVSHGTLWRLCVDTYLAHSENNIVTCDMFLVHVVWAFQRVHLCDNEYLSVHTHTHTHSFIHFCAHVCTHVIPSVMSITAWIFASSSALPAWVWSPCTIFFCFFMLMHTHTHTASRSKSHVHTMMQASSNHDCPMTPSSCRRKFSEIEQRFEDQIDKSTRELRALAALQVCLFECQVCIMCILGIWA